jgi:hypothetical protein
MRHQPADSPVSVDKGMDVVEAMMRGRHGNDPRGRSERFETVALLEILHEGADAMTRGRLMPPDGNVVLCFRTKFTWN